MRFFADDDFQFALEMTLGAVYRHAADVGEVMATVARIENGEADSWVREWTATAGAVWAMAGYAVDGGHRISALSHYLRAATYYGAALYRVAFCREPQRQLEIWRRQRECWDQAVDLFPAPGERIVIPYQDTTLPGYFFRAPGAEPDERRPLVVINNGSDGTTSQMWMYGGAAAGERGYHWMTFDGPGQQAALFEQGIPFRPDWEAVLTPVTDAVLARPEVDPQRLAVIGISQGGYWVPRALAYEHRFAAAVADPGVVDVSTSWTNQLPTAMRELLERGERDAFDREMHLAELFSPPAAATLNFRGEPYGPGDSRFDLYRTVASYRLGDELTQITTPLLVTDPEDEQFWPGQSRQLYDRLPGPKHLVSFSAREGSSRHCEPLASALRETQIFDWLDQYLTQPAGERSPQRSRIRSSRTGVRGAGAKVTGAVRAPL